MDQTNFTMSVSEDEPTAKVKLPELPKGLTDQTSGSLSPSPSPGKSVETTSAGESGRSVS